MAELIPVSAGSRGVAAARQMRAFIDEQRSDRPVDVKALIDEGRD